MRALVLIDLQNDFLPGGALAVRDGDAVIPVANRLVGRFPGATFLTQDWHPPGHASFASMHPRRAVGDVIDLDGRAQVLWPDHCVQGTPGAAFAADLRVPNDAVVVRKGTDPRIDSYSGFFDNGHAQQTELDARLRARRVDTIWVMGLATDSCVRWSVLDGRALGYRVVVVTDGCRGVELAAGDSARALDEMRAAGATFASSNDA